jgi:selenide,water dikinase
LKAIPVTADSRSVVGFSSSDDAAAYCLGNPEDPDSEVLLSTVDFFTPIVESPFDFGRIAAANALSDIYAMGGEPLFVLNIVAFPARELSLDTLGEILAGGADIAKAAGVPVLGGHSVDFDVPAYGMVVNGRVRLRELRRNVGARPKDRLVLTKPLGSGILAAALRARALAGLFRRSSDISQEEERSAIASMTSLNAMAARASRDLDVSACTDVTGFGLAGHLREMLSGPVPRRAEVWLSKIPFLAGARRLADGGIAPEGSLKNLESQGPYLESGEGISDTDRLLICDAQTSGGLLFSLAEAGAEELVKRLDENGVEASIIGRILEDEPGDPRIHISR